MRIIEPDYIVNAWNEVKPYMVLVDNLDYELKDDAPYYIKDIYVALMRREEWINDLN